MQIHIRHQFIIVSKTEKKTYQTFFPGPQAAFFASGSICLVENVIVECGKMTGLDLITKSQRVFK